MHKPQHLQPVQRTTPVSGTIGFPTQFPIGTVASRTGLAASAIRYYESVGVVPKPHRVSGRRVYDESWMKWLGLVLLAQDAGFSIAEIRDLVTPFEQDKRPTMCCQKAADHKIRELDEQMARIRKMKKVLAMMSSCGCRTAGDCGEAALQQLYERRSV